MTNIDEKKRYSMKKVTEITWKNSSQISYYIKKWFIKKMSIWKLLKIDDIEKYYYEKLYWGYYNFTLSCLFMDIFLFSCLLCYETKTKYIRIITRRKQNDYDVMSLLWSIEF